MVDTAFPYQVVLFTQHYSITGGLFLREQRLSDFLNDRRDTSILMRNTAVARLEQPAKILEKTAGAWTDLNHPDLETIEDVKEWVENLRRSGEGRPLHKRVRK